MCHVGKTGLFVAGYTQASCFSYCSLFYVWFVLIFVAACNVECNLYVSHFDTHAASAAAHELALSYATCCTVNCPELAEVSELRGGFPGIAAVCFMCADIPFLIVLLGRLTGYRKNAFT